MAAVIGSLRAELSASIAQFQSDMGKAADSVKDLSRQFQGVANDFKKTGAQMQGVGLALSKSITLPLAAISAAVFKVGTDFEDAFAGVRKTVSGTPDELNAISAAFRDMAKTIPTSATELAKIAENAGQLGVSKENVVAFTKTIAEIATATHLTAEEASTSFAKLAVVMKVPQNQFESLGSAVYSLGNFGASTEKEMLDLGQRIAGAGATVGLTAAQVLGLANAMASVGISAEAGGTAMSRVLIMMAKAAHDGGNALEQFAKVAGQSSQSFKTQFQTDAGGAVVSFIEGLGRIKDKGGDLIGTLDALGIKQARLRDTTLLLANAGHLVADSVDVSNKAFGDHTAFLSAVQERYKTTSNELKVLGNQIGDVGLTLFTSLKPAIEAAIQGLTVLIPYIDSFAKMFAGLPGGVQLATIGILAFAAALGPIAYIGGQVVSSMGTLVGVFGKTGLGTRVLVQGLSLAENAFGFLNTAIKVNGAVIGEWGSGSVILTGVAAQMTTALQGVVSLGMLPLAIATKAEAASQAFYATVVAATSGALDAMVVRLGVATVATRVKAAASAIATAAEEAFAVAIELVGGSSLVMGVRMVASNVATIAAGAAAQAAAAGYTALGIAIDVIQLTPVIGAFVALGFALREAASGVSNLVKAWNEGHLWETLTAKDDNTFARRWLGLSQGVDAAAKSAGTAADEFKTLKDRISGALATHDAGELTKVVVELSNAGELTGNIMRRVAVEVANLRAQGATLTPELENIAKAFGAVTASGGGNGFQDLTDTLKAARAEIAGLSASDLKALTEAVKSGAFTMKELKDETGLSETALKLFQDQVRANAKELKISQSIFDEYKKKVAELTPALNEAFKFNAPVEFIRKQFKTLVVDVVQDASILGKDVPKVIQDGFLQITLKDAADHMVGELATFGKKLNDQVKADLDKRNDQIIKALGASVDAQQQAAEAASQFSIQGLANEIKNLETVYGETKKSIDLKKQLYAEEYLYQVELLQKAAQAEKDGLDKKVGDYTGAYARIDAAVAAKVGLLSQNYQQKLTEMRLATKKWQDSLAEIASVFSDIASASDGSFSSVLKDLGNLVNSLDRATKAAKAFQAASAAGNAGGQFAAAGQGIAAVAQATSSKSVAASVIGGAITGAQLTAGLGYGAIIGAGVGALVGYIRAIHKGAAEKAALDVGRDFGIAISDGLAKELADLGKGIGRQAANIFDLDKIIAEGGGLKSANIQNFTKKLHDTFSLLGTGALTAADATHVLDSNFANFANYFLAKGPLISKDLVDIVKLTREWGLESKAVSDFIASQIDTNIIPGLGRFTTASKTATDALAENQKKLADLQGQLAKATDPSDQADLKKQIDEVTQAIANEQGVIAATAVTSQGAADALAASVLVAFNEMQKAGVPVLDIVAKLAPIVAQLGQQFAAAGFDGGAAFDKLRGIMALASDEIAGPAIDAATGLGQALAGLSNIGQLDQSTFTGLSDQIAATFDSLVAQGKDGNQVLALMKGPLQTIWELQQEFGYSVDAATQALLDQAVAAGVVGETQKPIQEQMLDATKAIAAAVTGLAKVFGVDLPEAGKTGADKLKDEFEKLNPKVKVDIQYNDPGFTPDVSSPTGASTGGLVTPMGIQHFAAGGRVRAFKSRGTDTVPAMLTPGEVVLTKAQQAAISASLSASMPDLGGQTKLLQQLRDGLAGLPADAETASNSIGGITAAMNTASLSGQVALQILTGALQTTLPGAVGQATDSIKGQFNQIRQLFAQGTPDSIKAGTDAATKLLAALGDDTSGNLDDMSAAVRNYLVVALQDLQTQFGDLPDDAKTAASRISDALSKIKVPTLKIDVEVKDPPGGTSDGVSTGGFVTPRGIQHFSLGGIVKAFRSRGTDTVPAMLTPGEVVLNRPQQDAITSALAAVTGISDIGSGGVGVLQGRASVVTEDQIAAMRKDTSRPVDVGGGDTNNFSFSLYAYDASGLQRLVTKPGGLADVLVTATSQGKRGLDEKLRRALRVPG